MNATVELVTGLSFPEGPRWRDGRLWFSDFFQKQVRSVSESGTDLRLEARVPEQPSGLGWLPNGDLLVVSMIDRRVLRLTENGLVTHADISALAPFNANDLLVDGNGRAYVGNFGSNLGAGEELAPTVLVLIHLDGTTEVAASDLCFPNGMVLSPDGLELVVCETLACRLTAFSVGDGGALTGRRVWAELPGRYPDGCCRDRDGAIWVAVPPEHRVLRLEEGGRILDEVETIRPAVACELGGHDGRTLFVCCSGFGSPDHPTGRDLGAIEIARVTVPR